MRPFPLLLLIAGGLAACGPSIRYERAPDRVIPADARWAWSPPDSDGYPVTTGGTTVPDTIDREIADAIENELVARRFQRTTPELAQFLVHYHLARRARVDTLPPRDDTYCPPGCARRWDPWWWYGTPEEIESRTVRWDEGTLVIDAVTPDGKVVLWRGVMSAEVSSRTTRDAGPAIRDGVKRVMRGFP